MKNWNHKCLPLFTAGFVLLIIFLPVLAQERNKTKFIQNKAFQFKKGTLRKANVSSKLIVTNRRRPIKFVPFALKDLRNPKTRARPTANTVLSLRNGRRVTAKQHLDAVNRLEKKLNTWGYSLRDRQRKVTMQHLAVNQARLNQQAKTMRRFGRIAPRLQGLAKSPNVLQREHLTIVRAARFGREPKINVGALLQPVSTVKSYSNSFGDPSTFGANVKAQLVMKGAVAGTSISAEGFATGSVLGNSQDLLRATASVTAPRSGGLSAKLKVSTLGVDQVILDKSQTAPWSKTGEFSRSLPAVFRLEYNFAIGPVPVSAEVGVKGTAKLPYFVGLTPGSSTVWMIPEVTSTMYAQAAVDFELLNAGVEAGVEGRMTLLDNKLVVAGGINQGADTKGKFVSDWYTSRNDVKTLAGDLRVYIAAEVAGYEIWRADHVLWQFGGISRVDIPFSGGQKRYLQAVAAIR